MRIGSSLWVLIAMAAGCSREASSLSETPPPATQCGTQSPEALALCMDRVRYAEDVKTVTGPRSPNTKHWQEVQDLCAARLTSLGFTVELHVYDTGVNVIGRREGTSLQSEEVIVSAHYDSVADCDGADDNATGVAGALEAARVLSQATFERSLVVACWDQEEAGLVGSRAYSDRAKSRGEKIAVAYVFETIGYRSEEPNSQKIPSGMETLFPSQVAQLEANASRGDFVAIIGDSNSHAPAVTLEDYAKKIGFSAIRLEVTEFSLDLMRSDHASFLYNGYQAVMLTDTANFRNPHYHCGVGPDSFDTLDLTFGAAVVRTTIDAAAASLGVRWQVGAHE